MELEAALTAIDRAKDIAELSNVVRQWRDESGLAHLVYHAVHVPTCDKPNPVLLLTYDAAWVDRYITEDYFQIDPVVRAGRQGFLPIDWMRVDHETPAAKHFFAEAESHGVGRHGFTMPILGPFGERGLFTITSNEGDEYWHRWRYAHLRDYALLAHFLHDRAITLAGLRYTPKPRALSRREQQCLQRLANGDTPQQIAGFLKISAAAVHMYLRSARDKLECKTIEHAVAKAVCLEFVQYGGPATA